jgi:hypothetical protein
MTTTKKIKILNAQIDKLQITEAQLNTFHFSNWKTETLEYIRVFFGDNSELYKKCKSYNDQVDDEHKSKEYQVGSALWILFYTDMLFSAIGILQHDIYKKSKFLEFIHGLSIPVIVGLIGLLMTIAFYVGKYDGIKLGQSVTPTLDTSKNVTQDKTSDSTIQNTQKQHIYFNSQDTSTR